MPGKGTGSGHFGSVHLLIAWCHVAFAVAAAAMAIVGALHGAWLPAGLNAALVAFNAFCARLAFRRARGG